MTPFEALFGISLPKVLDYVPGTTQVAADRTILLTLLKQNLIAAQARMKAQASQHRSDKTFQVVNWVYLRLHPYRQLSLSIKGFNKLSPRYFGPFQILQKLG